MKKMRQRSHRKRAGGFLSVLTDEQKAVLKAAREEAAKADTPEKKREIMKAAMEKVRESLSDEQKAAIRKMRKQRGGKHDKRAKGDKAGKNTEGEADEED